jgi:hypothetical protein
MAVTIGRRELLAALASAAATWPLAAHAQQAAKLPTIGFLGAATPSTTSPWISAFAQRLRELGWIEGRKTMRFNEGYRVRPAKPPHTFDQHSGARRRSARPLRRLAGAALAYQAGNWLRLRPDCTPKRDDVWRPTVRSRSLEINAWASCIAALGIGTLGSIALPIHGRVSASSSCC